ncbi:LOW QUALITY PROTEIN: hypothetical protein SETIT_1G191500v2 [Setaria italica]|uniref:Uncharacterized protein n=1 Tax=Setaria italica TaxID=4555 RepID=A0A368PLY5_SETIT|nr:LOW QUALITY PROTEIN: hypothetical protein SETIT_1G191500v2 [Setaria italica]
MQGRPERSSFRRRALLPPPPPAVHIAHAVIAHHPTGHLAHAVPPAAVALRPPLPYARRAPRLRAGRLHARAAVTIVEVAPPVVDRGDGSYAFRLQVARRFAAAEFRLTVVVLLPATMAAERRWRTRLGVDGPRKASATRWRSRAASGRRSRMASEPRSTTKSGRRLRRASGQRLRTRLCVDRADGDWGRAVASEGIQGWSARGERRRIEGLTP